MNQVGKIADCAFHTIDVPRKIDRGRYSGKFEYWTRESCFRWDSDISSLTALCRKPEGIAMASGYADTINNKGRPHERVEHCVYVVGVDGLPVSKIGISTNPIKRFDSLQENNWSDLYLFAVLWLSKRGAGKLETTALQAAREMGCHLRGEWVSMDADEAFHTVLKAARYLNVAACDGETWVKNWRSRILGNANAMPSPLEKRRNAPLYPI